MEKQNFLEEDWDFIVVLDSARYDVFEEIYGDYFSGCLERRRSPASATPEWVAKVFDGRHNLNYFSANPFINSIGLPLSEIGAVDYDAVPSRHIANVVDLWEKSWDEDIGTVKPEEVAQEFFDIRGQLADRRTVVHFMQPHVPFIGRGKGRINGHLQDSFSSLKTNGKDEQGSFHGRIFDRLPDLLGRIEESEAAMKLGLFSSLDPASLVEVIVNDTRETLIQYHEENMRAALEAVQEIVEDVDGRIVITSDHGDAFGEEGVWGHHEEMHISPLVEVPWLEVEEVKS